MRLLALETVSDQCSVALLCNGEVITRSQFAPRKHADLLLDDVAALLARAALTLRQLDGFAFGRGPGAFTGVRIGTGVIQGLAFGADKPVVPVSSLAAMAYGRMREHNERSVIAGFDARMGDVYIGGWQAIGDIREASLEAVLPEQVCKPADLVAGNLPECTGVGTAFATYGEELSAIMSPAMQQMEAGRYPQAEDVAWLAAQRFASDAVSADQALPVYLRDNVAKKPGGLS